MENKRKMDINKLSPNDIKFIEIETNYNYYVQIMLIIILVSVLLGSLAFFLA